MADAILGGEQSCTVTATSPDVVPQQRGGREHQEDQVVEPKLKLTSTAPKQRFTDTVADYKINVENPGTAPARKVRVLATLPISGRLVKVPRDARYDNDDPATLVDDRPDRTRRQAHDVAVPGAHGGHRQLRGHRRGRSATATSKPVNARRTEVIGMPDVDLVVSESKRVVDVGGKTTFQIRLSNYGTKEATNLLVTATLSENLKFEKAGGGSQDVQVANKTQGKRSEVRRDRQARTRTRR